MVLHDSALYCNLPNISIYFSIIMWEAFDFVIKMLKKKTWFLRVQRLYGSFIDLVARNLFNSDWNKFMPISLIMF
jgi:hypothetical protein